MTAGPSAPNGVPDAERLARGPCVVVECPEEIPCDPCHDACPRGAIRPFEDINHLPEVDFDKCNGCGACISACPGLAIFVVDETWGEAQALVKLPYEFVPLPKPGQDVVGLDRTGRARCTARVVRVQTSERQDKTSVVWIEVPKELSMEIRHIRVGGSACGVRETSG